MFKSNFTCYLTPLSLSTLLLILAFGEPAKSQVGNQVPVLGQLALAVSNGQPIQSISLNGSAEWTAGALQDSGTATLVATSDGASSLQLNLSVSGARIESQTGSGASSSCQWSGADGVSYAVSPNNCWKPALWFFPAFSFQASTISPYTSVSDLGLGSVGADGNTYRHLQSQLSLTGLPSDLTNAISQQSVSDIGLDPTTLLPAVLCYSILPDGGSPTPIAIEIHYSNYQVVNGVQVPFLIQRYINGALQLQITVNSAQLS